MKALLRCLIELVFKVRIRRLRLRWNDAIIIHCPSQQVGEQTAETLLKLPKRCLPEHIPLVMLRQGCQLNSLDELSDETKEKLREGLWED